MFGLGIHRIGEEGNQAVAVLVPPSVDGPHLIFRNDYFGAPIRNNANTVWMAEREIAAQYRAQFDAERHVPEVLDTLYAQTAAGVDSGTQAWLVAVARPRAAAEVGLGALTDRPKDKAPVKIMADLDDFAKVQWAWSGPSR